MNNNLPNFTNTENSNYDYSNSGQEQFIGLRTTNPLVMAKPVEKSYQNAGISHDSPEVIPEFEFPTADNKGFEIQNSHSQETINNVNENQESTFNPKINELPNKEKRLASEMMAEQIIEGYGFIWQQFLTPLGQFNKKKIEKAIVDGEISSSVKVPVSDTEEKPIRNFIEEFNESVAESLKVDQDFKDRVREPLIRVLEKKGLGLTDEQVLGLEVGKDFVTKTAIILSIRGDIKEITENFKERTLEMKRGSNVTQNDSDLIVEKSQPISAKEEPVIIQVKEEKKIPQIVKESLHPTLPSTNPSILADMEEEAKKLAENNNLDNSEPLKNKNVSRTPRTSNKSNDKSPKRAQKANNNDKK
jgi:hypothetical protein